MVMIISSYLGKEFESLSSTDLVATLRVAPFRAPPLMKAPELMLTACTLTNGRTRDISSPHGRMSITLTPSPQPAVASLE